MTDKTCGCLGCDRDAEYKISRGGTPRTVCADCAEGHPIIDRL